ncbi:long-chain fatty acid--CoA ligase [Rhodobacteraceae bacterium CCMM004]|nr:long-chain fatty acid--CoA ligase [Rhodobacteraceae bacterium CCMM004]
MPALFDAGPPDPCPAPFNLAAHVLRHARDLPDKTALALVDAAGEAETWTFGAMEAAVLGTAAGLLARGLAPGDRVLLRLGNRVEVPILYLAAMAVDLVPVPTSSQLTAPEVAVLTQLLSPALAVVESGVAGPPDGVPVLDLDAARALAATPAAAYRMGDPERLGYIVFSSGTGGTPRAVCHAHRAIWARRMMTEGWYGLRRDDRVLHAGAFNWTYTMGTGLMDPWAVGATALIPAPGLPPAQIPDILLAEGATIFAAAPGVYRQMLKRADWPALPALRHGLSAGEKLPDSTAAAWRARTRTAIHEAYGMSECSTFISGSPAAPAAPGTLGRPQPGRRIAVLDGDRPAQIDAPGEIAVSRRDPGLMLGYLDDPDATATRFRGEWFLTGDSAAMAEDGSLTYLGRRDDMMNAGGYRVSPVEVEEALTAHPDVTEAAAVALQVRADAAIVAAFYTGARTLDPDELARHCAARLARYKCPRRFTHVPALPRGANGKVLRRALRDAHGWKDPGDDPS